jgi:MFS family permease
MFDLRPRIPLLCAALICVAASMMLVFTPLLVDGLRHSAVPIAEHEVALIGSADQTGMFVGAILALILLPTANRRRFAIAGLALLAAGDLGSLLPGVGSALYFERVAAGVGSGMAMGVAYAAFGDAPRPERYFALFGLLQTGIGSAVILGATRLELRFGYEVWYAASLLLALAALGFAAWLQPGARPASGAASPASARPGWDRGLLVAATFFSLSLSASAFWSNAESIGRSFGIERGAASAAIAASLIASVAGSLGVLFTPRRWARMLPTFIVASAYVGGVGLLLHPQSAFGFLWAVAAFQFGTNLGFYAVGAVSESDPSGRLAVIYLLAMKAGFAAGPLCASRFVHGADFHGVVLAVLACAGLLCGLLWTTLRVFGGGKSVAVRMLRPRIS